MSEGADRALTTSVHTSAELHAALASAAPGSCIELADGSYVGAFVATGRGTAERPISLSGGPGAVLDGGGTATGYVLHLWAAHHWHVAGFTVRNGQKGVMADATTGSVIASLTVEDIGHEGIHLRSGSSGNRVVSNTVRRTGLRRDHFGEGIYVGSARRHWDVHSAGLPDRCDDNVIEGNDISETGAECIDVKEGTTGGRIVGNVMDGRGMTGADSLVDLKGNDWLVEGNTGRHAPVACIQTHRILAGWGTGNVVRDNRGNDPDHSPGSS